MILMLTIPQDQIKTTIQDHLVVEEAEVSIMHQMVKVLDSEKVALKDQMEEVSITILMMTEVEMKEDLMEEVGVAALKMVSTDHNQEEVNLETWSSKVAKAEEEDSRMKELKAPETDLSTTRLMTMTVMVDL